MTTKMKIIVTKLLLFITLLASTGILTSCGTNMAEYYGCPNSKRVNKLQLRRIKAIQKRP